MDDADRGHVQVGVVWLAVALCVGLVAWRKNLFLGLVAAVILAASLRAMGAG